MKISGFPDFLPQQQRLFHRWVWRLKSVFQDFGFEPMESPAVERLDTLLAKGGDHEIYILDRWKAREEQRPSKEMSKPSSALGLRFDLTVPLARYVTDYNSDLAFPHCRYHIAPVWRGERPQEGRYRQFFQCDIDVLGRKSLGHIYEAQVLVVMKSAIEALGILPLMGPALWRISHSGFLPLWAQACTIPPHLHSEAIRTIDKIGKQPFEEILQELAAMGANAEGLALLESWKGQRYSLAQGCAHMESLPWGAGIHEVCASLTRLDKNLRTLVGPDSQDSHLGPKMGEARKEERESYGVSWIWDPLLARGLTYYSGSVFELILPHHPEIGSVGGGGRYDNLAQSLGKESFPGVGLSLGLSRLLALYSQCAKLDKEKIPAIPCYSQVLITMQSQDDLSRCWSLARDLRRKGIPCEVFLEEKTLGQQLTYANKKGIPWVVMASAQDWMAGNVQVKCMTTGAQKTYALADISDHFVKNVLAGA